MLPISSENSHHDDGKGEWTNVARVRYVQYHAYLLVLDPIL